MTEAVRPADEPEPPAADAPDRVAQLLEDVLAAPDELFSDVAAEKAGGPGDDVQRSAHAPQLLPRSSRDPGRRF